MSNANLNLAQENEQLRRESRCNSFPTHRPCDVVGDSPRGMRAFRSRLACRKQRSDLFTLAQIKERFDLSLGALALVKCQ